MNFAQIQFRSALFQLYQFVSPENHIRMSTLWPECRSERLAELRVSVTDEDRVCMEAVRDAENVVPPTLYPLDADYSRFPCHCRALTMARGARVDPMFPRSYEQLTLYSPSDDAYTLIRPHVRRLFLFTDADDPRPDLAKALSRLDGRLSVVFMNGLPANPESIGEELIAFSVRHNLKKQPLRPRLIFAVPNSGACFKFFKKVKATLLDRRMCIRLIVRIEATAMALIDLVEWADKLPSFFFSSLCIQDGLTIISPLKTLTVCARWRRLRLVHAQLQKAVRFDEIKIVPGYLVFNRMCTHESIPVTADLMRERYFTIVQKITFNCDRLVVERANEVHPTAIRSYHTLHLRTLADQALNFVHEDLVTLSIQSSVWTRCNVLFTRLSHRVQFIALGWQSLLDPQNFGAALLAFSRRHLLKQSLRPRITIEFGRFWRDDGTETPDKNCGSDIIRFFMDNKNAFFHPEQRFVVQITSLVRLKPECASRLQRKVASCFTAVSPEIPHRAHDFRLVTPELDLMFIKRVLSKFL